MVDFPRTGNPFFDSWMDASRRFLESGYGNPLEGATSPEVSLAIVRAEETWKLCQQQATDWISVSARWLVPADRQDGNQGVVEETLRRMFDPSRFLFAGSDEVNMAIQRLVEGPEFADIGTLERQVLKATREWMALREASATYRAITAAAWGRAFQTFTREAAREPALFRENVRTVIDRWLAIANEELIRTQRTEAFLEAQRALLAAGASYRQRERELVEVWCKSHSMPTRTEVDDLHRTVHELRGQVRTLMARLAEREKLPAPQAAES